MVPFAFTIDPRGLGLLLQSTLTDALFATGAAGLGLMAFAIAATGWMRRAVTPVERVLAGLSALLLFIPRAASVTVGAILLAILIARQLRSGDRTASLPS